MNKILIVDDNPKNIQLLGNILSDKNYLVEYAMNGREAVEMVEAEHFDLILMDIMMPEMDGYEACKEIKELDKKKDIPLVFLTAKTDTESITYGFELGGVDYISKPFNEAELLSRVKTHIELKKSQDKLQHVNSRLEKKVFKRTEQLQTSNSKLKKAKEELEGLDKAKNDFLRIISHEIRTPLTGILGFVDLIRNETEDEVILEMINYLDNSCSRLEHFSITALEVSTFQANAEKVLTKQIADIAGLISNMLDKPDGLKLNPSITLKLAMEECPFLQDIDYMGKCLKILINNAFSHSPVNGSIYITGKKDTDTYKLIIKDEGKGFPEAIIKKGIDAFATTQHVDSNPCLDLYLSKLIIEAHGGNLTLINENGAKVEINLPYTREV